MVTPPTNPSKPVERDLQSSLQFLRSLTVADIERDGTARSSMVRSGLLLEIIDAALSIQPPVDQSGLRDELASYEKFDGIGPHSETIETRARIGERYLEAYESALSDPRLAGYTPADCPSELLLDLLNGTALSATPAQVDQVEGWRDIASAPKDGSYILAIVAPNDSRHLGHQVGRMFVIRHEGKTEPSGYDMGWAVYPGFGGASDHSFTHWMPLPASPSIAGRGEA